MLAYSKTPALSELKYPVMASPKLDGVRCMIIDGVAVSRNLKPIPNQFVQEELAKEEYNGLDGELCLAGDNGLDFNKNQSAFMRQSGRPRFRFYIFDCFDNPNKPFVDRLEEAKKKKLHYYIKNGGYNRLRLVPQEMVHDAEMLSDIWQMDVEKGFEGTIVRDPVGVYKNGRSTLKQGLMIKLKEWNDEEFEIVGFEELQRNGNEATINELGHQVRSSHQANKVAGGMLGALIVKSAKGVQFNVGTGYDEAERVRLWFQRDKLKGKLVSVKFNGYTTYGVPRFPVYKGIRNAIDC